MSEKTEQPTHKKLRDARAKGNVARSKDAAKALLVLACAGYLVHGTTRTVETLADLMTWAGNNAHRPFGSVLPAFLHLASESLVQVMLPWLALVIITPILAEMILVGPIFAPEKVGIDFRKLDVVANAAQMFSRRNLIEGLKSVAKVGVLGLLVCKLLQDNLGNLMLLPAAGVLPVAGAMGLLFQSLLLLTTAAFVVIAMFDFLLQNRLFRREQMMTKDEVRQEHKTTEGSPETQHERRKLHRELAQGSGAKPKRPTVVVTNPTHLAVALRYVDGETPVPQVVAKGAALQALAIIEDARRDGIPIIQHIPLARALTAQVDVEGYVPSQLFEMVIDVIKAVADLVPPVAASTGESG